MGIAFLQFTGLGLSAIALIVAVASFIVLQRFKVPIYLMVPGGALLGMVWTLV